jgi:hypothetical protein
MLLQQVKLSPSKLSDIAAAGFLVVAAAAALTAAAPCVHTCTAESRCSVHAVVVFTNADGSAINGTSNTLMDYIRDGKI